MRKIIILFSLVFLLSLFGTVSAQTPNPLDTPVTIDPTVIIYLLVIFWVVTLLVSIMGQLFGSAAHAMVSMTIALYIGTNGFNYNAGTINSLLALLMVVWACIFVYIAYEQSTQGGTQK